MMNLNSPSQLTDAERYLAKLNMSTTNSWLDLLGNVLYNGELTQPRGKVTRELLGQRSVIPMVNPVVGVNERKLGFHFMAAEAAWIMSGDNRVKTIAPYSGTISKFSDDGERFFGAYGPRVIDQLIYIVDALEHDYHSRQAVLTIWRPTPPPSKDIPCTISAQWMIREGKLHCFMNMRSSDVWLGVPYDWFNFSAISLGILITLNKHGRYKDPDYTPIELGNLYFYAASQHLYEEQFEKARFILQDSCSRIAVKPVKWSQFADYDAVVEHLQLAAEGGINAERPSEWLRELI